MAKFTSKPQNLSLLDKARNAQIRRQPIIDVTPEMIDLAIAWLQDEVTTAQVGVALKANPAHTLYKLAVIIREAYRNGVITATKF